MLTKLFLDLEEKLTSLRSILFGRFFIFINIKLKMPKKQQQSDKFVSRKDLRKNKKIEKKKQRQEYNQKKQDYNLYKDLKKKKPVKEARNKEEEKMVAKGKKQQKRDIPEKVNDRNVDEIEKLDNEIEYLESKLGIKGDVKKKQKEQKKIEMQGMGVGFLDFLDEIDNIIKDGKKYTKSEYQKKFKDYDFNDDAKEVMIDEADLMKMAQQDPEGDDQSGFSGDMQEVSGEEEGEMSQEEEGEMSIEEDMSQASDIEEDSVKSDDESDIEDDMASANSNDIKVDFQQSDDDEEMSQQQEEMEDEEEESGEISQEESGEMSQEESIQEAEKPKQEKAKQVKPKLDMTATSKSIRSILNKVSEGNIDPMFKQLLEVVDSQYPQDPINFCKAYSTIFIQLSVNLQQQMTAILSVNCVYISALQRLYGDLIFTNVARELYNIFIANHSEDGDKGKLKNILNCFLHFFIFKSTNGKILLDLIQILMQSFTESDIEILIFILHNIGLQLRKEDPVAIKSIIEMAEQKKNSYAVQMKMADAETQEEMKQKEKKINFLNMELNDIKNNKGNVTLQVRSIEHLQTWLKRDNKLSSELNIKPLELSSEMIQNSLTMPPDAIWWSSDTQQSPEAVKTQQIINNFKTVDSDSANQLQKLAKLQHMTTDIKKAVFQAIISSDDYIQAFENCQRLNLKKQQEREIIKVIVQCCINEKKTFNKFYALLAQRFIKENPQSYRYSFKYTLWDYLKSIDKFEVRQISNLGKLTGYLISNMSIPLHFLKVIEFTDDEEQEAEVSSTKQPVQLYLYILFEYVFENTETPEQIAQIFEQGITEDFGQGLSEYLLSKFYIRLKNQHQKLSADLHKKIKAAFSLIKKKSQNEFVAKTMKSQL